MIFKLDQIETFVEVAKHKSFSIAAANLNVTQPMVSSRIKKLEEMVGFKLINRNTKTVSLTKDGEALLDKSIEIIENIRDAERIVGRIRERAAPRIRIGAVSVHVWRRWWILESFMMRYPQAHLEIESGPSSRLAEKLLRGELDIAFMHPRASLPLEGLNLLSARYGLISRREAVTKPGPLTASDLRGQEVGLFRRELQPAIHDEITRILEPQGVRIVAIPEVTDEGILNFVRRMHFPVLSFTVWDDDSPPDDVIFQEIEGLDVALEFVVARASRTTQAAELLWRHCTAKLG